MLSDSEDERWCVVSLRLWGDGLDPDLATAALGLQPSYAARTGDHYNHNPRYDRHRTNFWTLRVTDDDTVPFDEQIPPLLSNLEAAPDAVSFIRQPEIDADLFLGFAAGVGFGRTASFPADLLARVGALGIDITMDLYPPSPSLALKKYERLRAHVGRAV